MPIDAAIPLSVQTPQFDILKPFQQAQQMKAGGEQLKALQMENQQRKNALDDEQKMRQVYSSWSTSDPTGNPDNLMMAAAKGGVGPKTLMGLQQQITSMKEAKAKLKSSELDNHFKTADAVHSLIMPAVNEQDPAKQAQLLAGGLQDGVRSGILTQDEAQKLATQYGTPDGIKQMDLHFRTEKWMSAEAAQQKAAAATKNANTSEVKTQAELPGIITGNQIKQQQATGTVPIQPAQQATLEAQQATHAETARHNAVSEAETHQNNLSHQSIARITAAISQGHLAQTQLVNGMKYGPGTSEYWVKQLQDNPDSIKEMPPELRSVVGKGFTQSTGLPLPTPAGANAQTTETAARNALDGAKFIQDALKNPEIRKNLGPIMGRLQEAEQTIGTSGHLSPEAAQLAQELRTRMRYFVFQEGKAVLGGRLPQQLMKQLEASSASPKMDPDVLQGALNGAVGNAHSVMDNVDRQRFGGKMRPRAMRGVTEQAPAQTSGGHVIEVGGKHYQYKGSGDTADMNSYSEIK